MTSTNRPPRGGLIYNAGSAEAKSVVICTPTLVRPYAAYLDALEASVPALDAAGIEHKTTFELSCTYISYARAQMLHRALQTDADAFIFIDHDMSWSPEALVKLIKTKGDVVAGLYRYKQPEVEYMGVLWGEGRVVERDDGCVRAAWVPAGFLKVTRGAVRRFMRYYPELCYGAPERPHVDLFNHGARSFVWFGEDYGFSERWIDKGEEIWVVPDLDIDHNGADGVVYRGNFHRHLLSLIPGAKQ